MKIYFCHCFSSNLQRILLINFLKERKEEKQVEEETKTLLKKENSMDVVGFVIHYYVIGP